MSLIKNKILIIYNEVLQSLIKIVELVDKSYLNYLTAVELIRNFYAFAIIDIENNNTQIERRDVLFMNQVRGYLDFFFSNNF